MKVELSLRESHASPIEVKEWLEWAGSKMLSLDVRSPFPQAYKSNWPDYANDANVAYGYTGEKLRPAAPRAVEIALMDKLLSFVNLVPDVLNRRIVSARCLVTPLSQRYLYSWNKLGVVLDISPRKVVRLHYQGLTDIATLLPVEKVDAVRRLLSSDLT